jgi:hypothetical protein
MTDELERAWKEEAVAKFNAISRHFPGGTEENHRKPESG